MHGGARPERADHPERAAGEASGPGLRRLQRLLDFASTPLAYFDCEGRCLFANSSFAEWRRSNATTVEAWLHEAHSRAALTGDSGDVQHTVRAADGPRSFRLGYDLDRDDAGVVRGVLLRVSEATESLRLHRAVRTHERRFRLLLQAAHEGVWIFDAAGRTQSVNDRMAVLLGSRAAVLLDTRFIDRVPQSDRDAMQARIAASLLGRTEHGECRLRREDGSLAEVTVVAFPIGFDDEGAVSAVACMCTDVTEMRRAVDHAAESGRQRDEFLGRLAHELRNPLAPIRNALEVWRLRDTPDTAHWARGIIERQAEKVRRIVDELADVSRVARGKVVVEQVSCDLVDLVRRGVEAGRQAVDERRHRLVATLPGDPIVAQFDPERLVQVVSALTTHAARELEPGGEVEIDVRRDEEHARITVRETGAGLEADRRARPFELFGHGPAGEGLGFDLGLARHIIEQHGGALDVQSGAPGGEWVYLVRLPLSLTPPSQDGASDTLNRTAGPAVAGWSPTLRVLIVEDNRDAAETLSRVLMRAGHQVAVAHAADEAVARVETFGPDAILLDIGLPGVDGWELARRFRARESTAACLLVALTGYAQPQDRQRARHAGFDRYLVKPADPEMVVRLLAKGRAPIDRSASEPSRPPATAGGTPR